ncbi:hypothetical protein QF035_011014 [Streptomyces umbrinus]|uniref:Integrase catalytic domain-containing protein n=1 Tax=Streptomyces umbrinus TaxID=67370 RepID=A0ABU0TCQ5_9ACTN|nr:hypothetical protein [Streptomyces umbrinus]
MAAGFPERLTATRRSPRFALLQKNVLDRRTWATRQELRIAIVTWIERTYHRRRRQRRLARLTPVEYETIMTEPQPWLHKPRRHPPLQQSPFSSRCMVQHGSKQVRPHR